MKIYCMTAAAVTSLFLATACGVGSSGGSVGRGGITQADIDAVCTALCARDAIACPTTSPTCQATCLQEVGSFECSGTPAQAAQCAVDLASAICVDDEIEFPASCDAACP